MGVAQCTNCTQGKYSAAGASSCTPCPMGMTSVNGSSSCSPIPTPSPTSSPTLSPTAAPTPPAVVAQYTIISSGTCTSHGLAPVMTTAGCAAARNQVACYFDPNVEPDDDSYYNSNDPCGSSFVA